MFDRYIICKPICEFNNESLKTYSKKQLYKEMINIVVFHSNGFMIDKSIDIKTNISVCNNTIKGSRIPVVLKDSEYFFCNGKHRFWYKKLKK